MSEMTKLVKHIHDHVHWMYRNHQSSFIGVFTSRENVQGVFDAIIRLVAELEHWPDPITYNYATFQIANQTLYLRCGIMLEVLQRPHSHPDGGEHRYIDLDVEKYTKVFFDFSPSLEDDHY